MRSHLEIALIVVVLAIAPRAQAASAIAFDDDGHYGYAMNRPSASNALQAAAGYCARQSANCAHTASTTTVGYSAIYSGTVALGYALAEADPAAAQRKAERMCRERADDCQLMVMWREQRSQVLPGGFAPPVVPGPPAPDPAH